VVCAKCGLVGTVFREVEHENNIHLRLFGIKNGQEIMMTKDHIIPRSVGGSNNFNNIQTMCCECNSTKQNEVNEKFIENARYSYKSIKDFIFNTYPQGPTRDRFSRDFSKLIRKIRKNNMISGFLCGDVDEILEYIRDIKIKYGFSVPLQKLKRLPGKDKRECFLYME
jgi:hypothetical protein